MNDWLLEIMKCPLSGEKLSAADAATVQRVGAQQRSGQLYSHKGLLIEQTFDAGLVNHSQTYFYRVSDGIPTLLPDEAVSIGLHDQPRLED